jgi:hypothetical protein
MSRKKGALNESTILKIKINFDKIKDDTKPSTSATKGDSDKPPAN